MERVIATSPDGLSWEISHTLDVPAFRSITWNGEHFVAADSGGVFRSADGTSWSSVLPVAENQVIRSVAWTGSTFLAVGHSDSIYASHAGLDWNNTPLGVDTPVTRMALG